MFMGIDEYRDVDGWCVIGCASVRALVHVSISTMRMHE